MLILNVMRRLQHSQHFYSESISCSKKYVRIWIHISQSCSLENGNDPILNNFTEQIYEKFFSFLTFLSSKACWVFCTRDHMYDCARLLCWPSPSSSSYAVCSSNGFAVQNSWRILEGDWFSVKGFSLIDWKRLHLGLFQSSDIRDIWRAIRSRLSDESRCPASRGVVPTTSGHWRY